MSYESNERLAEVYQSNVIQIIVCYPYVWKHEIAGDWFKIAEWFPQ